ncbi:hypothetical protein M0R45_037413 [Rubus argutus]|uniref:DUF7722 domain-containing protein n=1 Tax=Rubus argutus TaxID=59490 RepID=A0AAW1W2C3_RUBAR
MNVSNFQMPLHYPRYSRKDYQDMPEWKFDCLLAEYGLLAHGDLAYKRDVAMGTFLWPDRCLHDPNLSNNSYHNNTIKDASVSLRDKKVV